MKTRFEINIEVEALEAFRLRANGFPVGEFIRNLIDAYLEDEFLSIPQIQGTKARTRYHREIAFKAIERMKQQIEPNMGSDSGRRPA